MLMLNVPYAEKDEAKKLGARWNPDYKKWYVPQKKDYPKFAKWIIEQGDIVACDAIYILEGRQQCFRCGKETRVIAFAIENFFEFEGVDTDDCDDGIHTTYWEDVLRIIDGPIEPIPAPLLKYLQGKYNYKNRYSLTTEESHMNNCCDYCDVLQGDYYLFRTPQGPFFFDSQQKIEDLNIYKVSLRRDLIISAGVIYSTSDEYIKKYGKYRNLRIDL